LAGRAIPPESVPLSPHPVVDPRARHGGSLETALVLTGAARYCEGQGIQLFRRVSSPL